MRKFDWPSGPPFVRIWDGAKSTKLDTVSATKTNRRARRSSGSVIEKNVRSSPAPSILAAS